MSALHTLFIPSYFHLWHLPVAFLAGLIGEGYGTIIGSGSVLMQFTLASLGMPIASVIATDLAGCMGATAGVLLTSTSPKQIWKKRKPLLLLAVPLFLGGIAGTIFLIRVPAIILKYILVVVLPLLLLRTILEKPVAYAKTDDFHVRLRHYPILFPVLAALGFYNNVSGMGSGTFLRLLLASVLRVGVADSIIIGNIIALPTFLFSLVLTAKAGLIVWLYCLALWVGSYVGGRYAIKLARKVPNQYLRGLLIILVSLYLVWLLISLWHR